MDAVHDIFGYSQEMTKMEEPRTDRRVRKTKKQLRMALTTLMMEKSVGGR